MWTFFQKLYIANQMTLRWWILQLPRDLPSDIVPFSSEFFSIAKTPPPHQTWDRTVKSVPLPDLQCDSRLSAAGMSTTRQPQTSRLWPVETVQLYIRTMARKLLGSLSRTRFRYREPECPFRQRRRVIAKPDPVALPLSSCNNAEEEDTEIQARQSAVCGDVITTR